MAPPDLWLPLRTLQGHCGAYPYPPLVPRVPVSLVYVHPAQPTPRSLCPSAGGPFIYLLANIYQLCLLSLRYWGEAKFSWSLPPAWVMLSINKPNGVATSWH